MGPKLVNCCRPEQMGTKEFGKMMKRIQTLEEGRVPDKEAKNWRIEEEKKRMTRKEHQRLLNSFEMEGLVAPAGLWNLAMEKIMKERGELPNEEGDAVREYRVLHEENFWSSCRREDERGKEERMAEAEKNEEENGQKRTNRGESKENVRDVFLWRPLESSVKRKIWRVVVVFLGEISWRGLRVCLIVSPILVRMCVWCLLCACFPFFCGD